MNHAPQSPFPFELISDHLSVIERDIRAQAELFEPEVRDYFAYVCDTSGKRIRPALAILVANALDNCHHEHHRLGVILELIHLATLIHDDIIDGADTRRDTPTANAKWGNAMSVLLGDCLFAHSMTEATLFDDLVICRKIGKASRDVCTGEIIQTQSRFDLNLTRENYFRIIEMKTGALFAIATELAAVLSGASAETAAAMYDYGMKLGTAYQIYDDCVDLVGKEEAIGKTLGTDLERGKLTLPIINLMESVDEAKRESISAHLLNHGGTNLDALAEIADYKEALNNATQTGHDLLSAARKQLECLPANPSSAALEQITRYLDGLLSDCAG
ncbi:polyprenyl synthetase family protein [Sulfuriroseicoccus oceanibius]|uniref:polyprenyl synthetase family protein n=1 Tax=Sulfuriroseicoccus oceanibius TaxID=2707525 RepID=UPI001F1EA417|nr:polyprenyl synthetase family protein [Sulfuriroseicoccus oceanibius]